MKKTLRTCSYPTLTHWLSYVAVLLISTANTCTNAINTPGHHPVFSCLVKNAQPDGILRLYFDSGGNIYPAAQYLPDSPEAIRFDNGVPNSEVDLQWYFDRHQPIRDQLFADYGVPVPQTTRPAAPPYSYDHVAWDALRQKMAYRVARTIDQATDNGRRPLVVLIHGFNVADTAHATAGQSCANTLGHARHAAYYTAIRRHLLALRPELAAAAWLEVYWDGFQEAPLSIWGGAQVSARYAGLGLREVLRQTQPATPVRVFTHSAGGVVISQALWNNDAFSGSPDYETQLRAMFAAIPTPSHHDLRVGMLVPALTSQAFVDYGKRTFAPDATDHSVIDYRLVVGQNRRDFAVNKGPLGSEKFGATSMGAREEALEYARQACTRQGCTPDLRRVNFCVTPDKPAAQVPPTAFAYPIKPFGIYETHDWGLYFLRHPLGAPAGSPVVMKDFLAQVLD